MRLLGKVLIFVSFLLLSFGSFLSWERTNPNRIQFDTSKVPLKTSTKRDRLIPVRLTINSAKIDLPIYSAKIHHGQWEDTKDGVSYLDITPAPGEKGNSVLYGHNWPNLLGNLSNVKTGQEIQITLSDGSVRTFIVEFISVVNPDSTYILYPTSDNRITLYTCTGFLDSKRLVVTASLKAPQLSKGKSI